VDEEKDYTLDFQRKIFEAIKAKNDKGAHDEMRTLPHRLIF